MSPPESSATSQTVQVRHAPGKGRALTTTTTLRPGTTILATTTPLLLLPSVANLSSICTHCLRSGSSPPRACTRCHSAYYCGPTCQRAHWRAVHSVECKPLSRLRAAGRGPLPTLVRLLVQALLKESIAQELADLEGNVEAIRSEAGGTRWADIEVMALGACACAGVGTGEEQVRRACELMCKIQTNAFNWSEDNPDQTAVFVEPTLAMINHSCVPSAEVQVAGRNIVLRASMAIQAGEEIEITYIDYTLPRPKRNEALAPYNFQCQCPRCRGNLNIYQASALYPHLDLNCFSLAPEVSQVHQHPAVVDTQKAAAANTQAGKVLADIESSATPDTESSQHASLCHRYQRCKNFAESDFWAMAPLPHLVADASSYYAAEENWSFALTTACLMATACDSYRYPPPFHSVRVQDLFRIAKLLSNTAADTSSLSQPPSSVVSKSDLNTRVQDTLKDIDQVSLCQMLLMMALRLIPEEFVKEWDLAVDAQDMLKDIGQLPGRDKALTLINAWATNPEADQSRKFFQYAVVDPVHTLASLGKEALKHEFRGA